MSQVQFYLFCLLLSATLFAVSCKENDDLTLTYGQKVALDKFKARVSSLVPHRYMREDIYLINFLRAKNFDINQAERFLEQNLRWRKQHKMDTIHEEDFSDVFEEYPVYVDATDKKGAPVITAETGTFNLRKAVLTGQSPRLHRFLYKIIDEACMKIREAQRQGKPVTRFQFLLNLEGFNLAQHGCPRCVLGILDFLQHYESYFPGMTDNVVLFNAPPSIQVIRPVVFGALSGITRSTLKLIGTNKPEWQNYILKFIDASQLTEEFGGTRVRQLE